MRRRTAWRARWTGVVACGVVVVGGCVGTTDRGEFDAIIQERGGGFTAELPLEAVDVVAAELGVEDFDVRSMSVTPASELVVMEVRDPQVPANLDTYVVRRGEVESVEPVRLSASDDLAVQTYPVSSLALDRVEAMVDTALARFDEGGYVSSLTVNGSGDEAIFFQMALESPRSTATARFTREGELVDVTRT